MSASVKPRCRPIEEGDLDAVGDLLTRGFAFRSREYWMRGLHRQRSRPLPPGVPRYGYLMESDGGLVGCLLLIYSSKKLDGEAAIFCNLSSWYVDPAFRSYAALFASMAQKIEGVTYFNVTPDQPTWPILEAQGYQRYCYGSYVSVPAASRARRGFTVERILPGIASIAALPEAEFELLKRHAEYGCLSLICHTADGPLPFIFMPLRKRCGVMPMPAMKLCYCRDILDYVRCAFAIGHFLLWRGKPIVVVDANRPIEGLPGFYTATRARKYFKGPHSPRLGDLADTELVIYGM